MTVLASIQSGKSLLARLFSCYVIANQPGPTMILQATDVRITDHFSLYTIWGIALVYLYFQFPLMVLVIAPAIDGLRREWREAAENMGATTADYWRRVALPILMPSLLGSMILLFGNAFGAQATAYALTGGFISIVPILIAIRFSFNEGRSRSTAQARSRYPARAWKISFPAFSRLSEPCTEFSPIERANNLRIVPSAACSGLVAPMISR